MDERSLGSTPRWVHRAASRLSDVLTWQAQVVTMSASLAGSGLWWLLAHRQASGLDAHITVLTAAALMWTAVAVTTAVLRAVPQWWASAIIAAIICFCLLQGLTFPSTSLRWVTLACLVGVPLVAVLLLRPLLVGVTCASCAVSAVVIALHLHEPAVIRWYVAVTLPAIVVVPTVVTSALLHRLEAARSCAAQNAVRDPLTGLFNRRGLADALPVLSTRALKLGESVFMVLADVDHFKVVNDEHGHQVGDAVLAGLADVLRTQARTHDIVVRMGGEEVAWLFPAPSMAEAMRAAERFRSAVQVWRAPGLPAVTVSIGVSAAGGGHTDPAAAVRVSYAQADRALYEAKAAGRNRVQMAASAAATQNVGA